MTIDEWLQHACADAERRGLPELVPLLTTLSQATRVLRASAWNDDARTGVGSGAAALKPPQNRPSAAPEGGQS
ncbi:MAG: hypothetical protein AABY89_00835 [Acidobacteriota bacterium]